MGLLSMVLLDHCLGCYICLYPFLSDKTQILHLCTMLQHLMALGVYLIAACFLHSKQGIHG